MSTHKPDAGIPTLTEIIAAPDADDFVAAPAAANADASPPASSGAAPAATPALSEDDLQRIEHDIAGRVLQQLLARIDFVLEQRVRDGFADVLQLSVERVTSELRDGLRQSLGEAVTRAVSQEISRLRSNRK